MKAHVTLVLAAALALAACSGADRQPDPANELPFGVVDTPAQGSNVPAKVTIAGWAMDDHGVKQVRIFVDGHFVTAVANNTPRPDVSKAFPKYVHDGDLHGWTTSFVFTEAGPHTVIVQALDTNGATRDIGTIVLTSHE